jgi:hypothetical protein
MDHGVIECLGMEGAYVLDILEDSVVYVSGPATTTDATYAEARAWLRSHSTAHVTTPNRLVDGSLEPDQQVRERVHELTKRDYSVDEGGLVRRPWYDLVVTLEGWKASEGCKLEVEVARACGIEVMSLNRLKLKHAQEQS